MALQKGTVNGQVCIVDSAATSTPVSDVTGDGGDIIAAAAAVLANCKLANGDLYLSNGRIDFGTEYYISPAAGFGIYNSSAVSLLIIDYASDFTQINTTRLLLGSSAPEILAVGESQIDFMQAISPGGALLGSISLESFTMNPDASIGWNGITKLTSMADGQLSIRKNDSTSIVDIDEFNLSYTSGLATFGGVATSSIAIDSGGSISFNDATFIDSTAGDTLCLRNGTNLQSMHINRTHSGSLEEYLELFWYGGDNQCYIQTNVVGGGQHRNLVLGTAGSASVTLRTSSTDRWRVTSTGQLVAATDNTTDIGTTGNLRPRDIHLGRNLVGRQTGTGVPTTTHFTQSGAWGIYKNASGVMLSYNDGGVIKSVTLT